MTDPLRDKSLTFTLVGHAHLDPVWLWDWREGYEALKATFVSALDRLRENPDMGFVHSSAAQYAWMEAHPALLDEVRAAVSRGQWEPVGGLWVEPDVNLAGGEALARQALYGQRALQRLLGRRARVGFLPDSFGHPHTLPMLLHQSGLESFVFMRPNANELELPAHLFTWVGPDGSAVLALRLECYSSNPLFIDSSLERNLAWRPAHLREWVGLFGVGNHGGGPTIRSIESIRALQRDPGWPTLKLGGLESVLERLAEQVEHVHLGELQHHARGCYAAHSPIKRLNREAEGALLATEALCVLASQHGLEYPRGALETAWKTVLFNQFHDILAGSSIESACQDAERELGGVLSSARKLRWAAMQFMTDRIDTRRGGRDVPETVRSVRWDGPTWVTDYGDGVPLVVFNPSSAERCELLEVELNDWHTDDLRLEDEAGEYIAHQFTQPESASGGRPRFLVPVEVPALGYRTYRAVAERAPEVALPGVLEVSETRLENDFLSLSVDPVTGALSNLFDKRRGLELLSGAGAQLRVMHDPTDTWGHGLVHLRHLLSVFTLERVEVLERGPLRAALRVHLRQGNSRAVQTFTLERGGVRVLGQTWVDWREQHRALALGFPLALSGAGATYGVPYGHVERPGDGQEEPVQGWLDLSGQVRDARGQPHPAGVSLLTGWASSASALGGDLALTVLRSPVFAHHDPAPLEKGRTYRFQDQGEHTLRWALLPHAGDWRAGHAPQQALEHGTPLEFVREYVHAGDLPSHAGHLRLEAGGLIVSALKRAEDGAALIVRLFDPHGQGGAGTLELFGRRYTVSVPPHAVRTLRLGADGSAREVNFLEEEA